MFEYLQINLNNENCVKEALTELVSLTKEDSSEVDSAEKRCIIKAMKEYMQNVDIQVAACNTLNNLVMTGTFSSVSFGFLFCMLQRITDCLSFKTASLQYSSSHKNPCSSRVYSH